MPIEPHHFPAAPSGEPAIETAAVLGQAEAGYGGRFDEDAFDYPSSAAWDARPGDASQRDRVDTAVPVDEPDTAVRAHGRGHTREPAGWQQLVTRRRPLLAVAAALVVMGGFGFALSAVSDTVTSDPAPGGTAQVSAPRSPTEQPQVPGETAPAPPSGTGAEVLPTPTGSTSAISDRRDDKTGGQEDQQREDGDRSGDD
ncbi:hypothetical protein [Streptomyces longisporus]|uniref:Uncharacterized protein n=1 Tax=Streptomyces longisporus TaxID=1948 RepID=A0ABN3M147_STRLO